MRLLSFVLALLGALACSGFAAAADSPLYSEFQTFCVAHQGAAAPALAAADAAGWMTLNSSMVPMPSNGSVVMKSYQVRLSSVGGGAQVLLVGDGTTNNAMGVMDINMCLLISQPADPAGIDLAKAWLGTEPFLSSQQFSLYLFDRTAARPAALDRSAAQGALKTGRAAMVMIMSPPEGKASILGYMVPKTVSPAPRP